MFRLLLFDRMAVQREGPACQPGEKFPDQEVFVGVGQEIQKGIVGGEVDFLVKEGLRIVQSIQVWQADSSETAIPARELVPFESRLRSADSGECLLITNDLERVEKVGKKEIRCVPLALFLLGL